MVQPDRHAAMMHACAGAMLTEAVRSIAAPCARPNGNLVRRGVRWRVRSLGSSRRQTRIGVPRDEGTDDSDYHEVRHRNADNAP